MLEIKQTFLEYSCHDVEDLQVLHLSLQMSGAASRMGFIPVTKDPASAPTSSVFLRWISRRLRPTRIRGGKPRIERRRRRFGFVRGFF